MRWSLCSGEDWSNRAFFPANVEVKVDDVLEQRKIEEAFNAVQSIRETAINDKRKEVVAKRVEINAVIEEINRQKLIMANLEAQEIELSNEGKALPKPEPRKDLTDFDEKIKKASVTNALALAYTAYMATINRLNKYKVDLSENTNKQKDAIDRRLQAIKEFNLPFSNLEVDEEGQLLMEGRPLKSPYFSSGELVQIIPCLMSSRNPELRYVYLQDFNLLDEQKQKETVDFLSAKGLQLCIEYVGEKEIADANVLYMKDDQPEPMHV